MRGRLQQLEGQVSGLTVQVDLEENTTLLMSFHLLSEALPAEQGGYLTRGAALDVGGADVFSSSLQAEVVGGVSVLLTGQVELEVLLAEFRAQEGSKHRDSNWQQEREPSVISSHVTHVPMVALTP